MAEVDTLTFEGIGFAESQDRYDEHRTGVPPRGAMALLQHTTGIRRTSKVNVWNAGKQHAHVRLRHQGATYTQTGEYLTAYAATAHTVYNVPLQYKSIVPSSLTITPAAGPAAVVDDGLGNLWDTGFVGITGHLRGTVNYVTGQVTLTFPSTATEPVRATYMDTDYQDFSTTLQVASGTPVIGTAFALPYGRVNPGSVSLTDGTNTWVDDGKGNIILTVGAGSVEAVGTIDYARGLITLTTGPVPGALTTASVFTFNPFAAFIAPAAGAKLLDMFSQIPELTNYAWGKGCRSELNLGLSGESYPETFPSGYVLNKSTNLICQWFHFSEEPYRVQEDYSGFPPGGYDNDPNVIDTVSHL
jgi:hypothetical protein